VAKVPNFFRTHALCSTFSNELAVNLSVVVFGQQKCVIVKMCSQKRTVQ